MTRNSPRRSVSTFCLLAWLLSAACAPAWSQCDPPQELGSFAIPLLAGGRDALAIDGDTLLMGDAGDSSLAESGGAVLVFQRVAGAWSLVQKLTPAVPKPMTSFGSRVDVSGDIAIIAAPGQGVTGCAYVFERVGGVWQQVTCLIPPEPLPYPSLGSVAADGGSLVVCWAAQLPQGIAYVFEKEGGFWVGKHKLQGPPAGEDGFGATLALEADTLLIGAPNDASQALGSGAVHVFSRRAGEWKLVQTLHPSVPTPWARFGHAISLSGDSALIGAPSYVAGEQHAYVFRRDRGVWSEVSRLDAPQTPGSQKFGWSVALHNSLALVGAPLDAAAPGFFGTVSVFEAGTAGASLRAQLTSTETAPFQVLGWNVAWDGDAALATSADRLHAFKPLGLPAIVMQPVAGKVAECGPVTLSVGALGTNPLTFQWRKDGVELSDGGVYSGAKTSTLQISSLCCEQIGHYDVVVTDGACSITSAAAPVCFYVLGDWDGNSEVNQSDLGILLKFWTVFFTQSDLGDLLAKYGAAPCK